jgi:hypothetical protein
VPLFDDLCDVPIRQSTVGVKRKGRKGGKP